MTTVSKKCNRCGKGGLDWNREYFEKKGKWQIMDHKKKDGEWCVRNNYVKQEKEKITKKDFTVCPLCTESNFGYLLNSEYEEHKKKFHPNGEILTDLDYIHKHQSAYTTKKFWKHDPHYEKYL